MAKPGNAGSTNKLMGRIQFMVIPQNGDVSIPVPISTQTPR